MAERPVVLPPAGDKGAPHDSHSQEMRLFAAECLRWSDETETRAVMN